MLLTDNLISTQDCTTQFNDLNKISSLQENGMVMTIDYGPDIERCFSILKQDNTILRKVKPQSLEIWKRLRKQLKPIAN